MPRQTHRNELIEEVRSRLLQELDVEYVEGENEQVDELASVLDALLRCQYVTPRFHGSAGALSHSMDEFFELPANTFITNFCMPPNAFNYLANVLEMHYGDKIWHVNSAPGRPGPRGMSVKKQLLVGLFALGSDGSGMEKTRLEMKMGKGTCHQFLSRVITALAGLATQYIRWPSREEQQNSFRSKGVRGCIGYLDGSEMWLRVGNRQEIRHETYFSRKKRYGFNIQAICDGNKEFIYIHAGSKGSIHDSIAFKSSALYRNRQRLFHPSSYILADKAYELDRHILTRFKENAIGDHAVHIAFNDAVTAERINIEHAFGIPQNRWPSLRSIPIKIHGNSIERDHARVINSMMACMVLHNFLRRIGVEDVEDDGNDGFDENYEKDEDDIGQSESKHGLAT